MPADCTRGVGLFCLSVNALLTLSVGVTLAKGHGREAIKKNLGSWMGQFAQCNGFPRCVICSAPVFSRDRFVVGHRCMRRVRLSVKQKMCVLLKTATSGNKINIDVV